MGVRQSGHWKKQKEKVFRLSNGLCYLCGRPVVRGARGDLAAEIDHIVPLKLGGDPFELENLAVTHRICNRIKGSKTAEELFLSKAALLNADFSENLENTNVNWLEDGEGEEDGSEKNA